MSDWQRALHQYLLACFAGAAIAVIVLLLTACSGGGSPGEPRPVPQRAQALEYGYYGGCSFPPHVTLVWAMGWCEDRSATIAQAKQQGKRVVLYLPEAYQSDQAVRDLLTLYRGQGLLDAIAYLYPADEPDLTHGPLAILEASARARRIAAEVGIAPRLAVIYAGANDFPGVESFDVIGLDDYQKGANVLGDYQRLRSVLAPHQRLMLVPGGADPWRQDPAPFFAYARANGDVEMVTPFLWSPDFADRGVGLGIEHNGMALSYCREAGGPC